METHEYQPFFDGLLPRLETARTLQRELDSQLAQRFNVFDYLRTDELGLSRVIADLLNPRGKHGQGPVFLELLLRGLKLPFATSERLDHASVEVERVIKDGRRLDICVRIGNHCLAIENKPYAGDQPGQVDDYLHWLKSQGFESSLLIYLSPQGEPPSPESVELADLQGESNAHHFFNIMPYHGAQEDVRDDDFGDYRLDFSLAGWLADCQKRCKVDRLRWFLRDAEIFCKRIVGGQAVTSTESNTVKEFVLADQEKWDAALALSNTLPQIRKDVCLLFMDMIGKYPPTTTQYKYPADGWCQWRYSPTGTSYIYLHRKSWRSYKTRKGNELFTQIRLESYRHINKFCIGVLTANGQLADSEQEGWQELDAALRTALGESEKKYKVWPWWQWVDERYRNWDALIPTLSRECNAGGGDVTSYFVEKLAVVAKAAIPIIDRYEGT